MTAPRVAVVVKRTTYRKFVVEEHDPLLTRLLRRHDPTVTNLLKSNEAHEETCEEVDLALEALGANVVHRAGWRAQIPKHVDLVVTIGGDGTLLSASHQIGRGVPLLGVNSAPDHSVGFFCAARKGRVKRSIARALEGTMPRTELTRMRVDLNGTCIHSRVLNEALVCHASPAATSRYILRVSKLGVEDQRSSGLWIGPAAGSTAAQRSAGGRVLPLASKKIQYVVREPYTPAGGHLRFARGLLAERERLVIQSKMREAKLFLDGHSIVHPVTIGDVLVMRRSEETLTVLGLAGKRRL
ncbi:MAG TPA: NAD(+)/NADH kinase [Labilithrix sp.]